MAHVSFWTAFTWQQQRGISTKDEKHTADSRAGLKVCHIHSKSIILWPEQPTADNAAVLFTWNVGGKVRGGMTESPDLFSFLYMEGMLKRWRQWSTIRIHKLSLHFFPDLLKYLRRWTKTKVFANIICCTYLTLTDNRKWTTSCWHTGSSVLTKLSVQKIHRSECQRLHLQLTATSWVRRKTSSLVWSQPSDWTWIRQNLSCNGWDRWQQLRGLLHNIFLQISHNKCLLQLGF